MTSTFSSKLLLLGIIAVALIGLLDAAIGEVWDHVALFAFGAVLAGSLLLRTNLRRRAVSVRHDHARWLVTRAQVTGEDVERITDRAIATYRHALALDVAPADGMGEPSRSAS
jgi:hypothetical protein